MEPVWVKPWWCVRNARAMTLAQALACPHTIATLLAVACTLAQIKNGDGDVVLTVCGNRVPEPVTVEGGTVVVAFTGPTGASTGVPRTVAAVATGVEVTDGYFIAIVVLSGVLFTVIVAFVAYCLMNRSKPRAVAPPRPSGSTRVQAFAPTRITL